MTREATDRTAGRILRELRASMLGQTEIDLRRVEAAYQQVADRIQEDLRGMGQVVPRATIERIARERLNDALAEVLPVIQANIIAGAETGASTVGAQFAAIFPDADPPRIAARIQAQREAARVLRGQTTVDRIPLSSRVRARHDEVAQRMAREVESSMRAGQSAFEVMERIQAVDAERVVDIPRYIQELADAAREGGPALEAEIASARRYIESLGGQGQANASTSIRSATEDFVQRLQRANAEDIDGLVERWARDKAQYHAKVIARTETVEAHRRAYIASNAGKPWVKGYKWSLGSGHDEPDICDLLANQNLHGLGPGGYPADALPSTPHPSDLCTQCAIIDEHWQDRELAELEGTEPPPETWRVGGEQTAAEWLAEQPEQMQRRVLGPTRHQVFQQQPDRVLTPQGDIRLVRDVLGAGAARDAAE